MASSFSPAKYWSSTCRNRCSCGAAWSNNVIDDRSFWASTRPRTCAASVPGELGQHPCAVHQPRPQHGVREVGASLGQPGEGEVLRHRAPAEAGDLREDEPHPVAPLSTVPELAQHTVVGVPDILGIEEPLQREGIIHRYMVTVTSRGTNGAGASA